MTALSMPRPAPRRRPPRPPVARADIVRAAYRCFVERPPAEVSLSAVAVRLDASPATVRRRVGDIERLYEMTVRAAVETLATQPVFAPPRPDSSLGPLDRHLANLTGLVTDPRYADLLLFVLRDGPTRPWLNDLYETRIRRRLRAAFEAALRERAHAQGTHLLIGRDAAARFVALADGLIALPALLPGSPRRRAGEVAALLDIAVKDALGACFRP